ncbi:selenoprotein F [Panulirus ornatus]|uniref:selenoprotein F n=1 Tax=Panulirus ornatus TaxID=150431 RepID=UPI003A891FD8
MVIVTYQSCQRQPSADTAATDVNNTSTRMMGDPGGICFLILGTLMSIVDAVQELSTEDCFAVGLNKANLLCSSCDTLKEFNLDILESNCRRCCNVDDVNATPTKYPRAQLEVCG